MGRIENQNASERLKNLPNLSFGARTRVPAQNGEMWRTRKIDHMLVVRLSVGISLVNIVITRGHQVVVRLHRLTQKRTASSTSHGQVILNLILLQVLTTSPGSGVVVLPTGCA